MGTALSTVAVRPYFDPQRVNLLLVPYINPKRERTEISFEPGTNVATMLDIVFSMVEAPRIGLDVRVMIGDHLLSKDDWHKVKPHTGSCLIVRAIPHGGQFRTILTVLATLAAVAIGNYYAPSLALTLGVTQTVAKAIIVTSITVAAHLLFSLIPMPQPDEEKQTSEAATIQGWNNQANPGGPVPCVYGYIRYAPPYAALPYSENVKEEIGRVQYVTALFTPGYGPINIYNMKIGETDILDYVGANEDNSVEIDTRYGYEDDDPITLYPSQVIEVNIKKMLDPQLPKEDRPGNYLGPALEVSAADATELSIDVNFPSGLFRVEDEGDNTNIDIHVYIDYRLDGTDDPWIRAGSIDLHEFTDHQFIESFRWTVPERARYEIQLTRSPSEKVHAAAFHDDVEWVTLRTFKPEYPIAFPRPLCLIAVRIKATYQLQGTLDEFNFEAERICMDWQKEIGQWVFKGTDNPASAFRFALQGPQIRDVVRATDAQIDLETLQEWHEFCEDNGLHYNDIHDADASMWDVLVKIAGAGRARPVDDGYRWSVIIDRKQDVIVGHVSPRNSWGFEYKKNFVKFPDALLVSFKDENNKWQSAERTIPRPDLEGDPQVVEQFEIPGKTSADEVWIEARKRWYEILNRPNIYTVSQTWEHLIHSIGSRTQLSHYVLDRSQQVARVAWHAFPLIGLDDVVTIEEGKKYGIRFRHLNESHDEDDDPLNESFLMEVDSSTPGETTTVTVVPSGHAPDVGDLAFFGVMNQESHDVIVQNIERSDKLVAQITFIDHAPEIYDLTDAEIPPPFDGRVGEINPPDDTPPTAPFVGIETGTNAPNGDTRFTCGTTGKAVAGFTLQHRKQGASSFKTVALTAANNKVVVTDYTYGDIFQVKAKSESLTGIFGPYCDLITYIFGSDESPTLALTFDTLSMPIGGGEAVKGLVSWDDPTVSASTRSGEAPEDGRYEVEYRRVGGATRNNFWAPIGQAALETGVLDDDTPYEARARIRGGPWSAWVQSRTASVLSVDGTLIFGIDEDSALAT